jgi:hypothetical protein
MIKDHENIEIVKLLIPYFYENNLDLLRFQDQHLSNACYRNNIEVINLLVEYGMNLKVCSCGGKYH